jgi:ribulose 1,5-bisphosphate synthetase/thiazole synthase
MTTTNDAYSTTRGPRDIGRHLAKEKSHMEVTEKVSSTESMRRTAPEEYELVILGGGTGSTIAASTFAKEGPRVAVIERKYIGGSCPNIASAE